MSLSVPHMVQRVHGRLHLEVVELAGRQFVIELLHQLPRAIAHADNNDGDRVVRGFNDRRLRILPVRDLPVGYDDKDVV
eukprot:3171082-Rhodomonas_salina.2